MSATLIDDSTIGALSCLALGGIDRYLSVATSVVLADVYHQGNHRITKNMVYPYARFEADNGNERWRKPWASS